MKTYEEIKLWRDKTLFSAAVDSDSLNLLHDKIMRSIVDVAVRNVQSEWGPPPAHFAFFVMGSAGRSEQTLYSDQDHGIIHEGNSSASEYFLLLGKEISDGFAKCGYPYCEGKVMASNRLWNKSLPEWSSQLRDWFDEGSWQSLRNFTIFFDSRVLFGEEWLLTSLKEVVFLQLRKQPYLLLRIIENLEYIKKGIGPFGQFITERYGDKAGSIHFKDMVFFPYVNSLRLIALNEYIMEASTMKRFKSLSPNYYKYRKYENDFVNLLKFRLQLVRINDDKNRHNHYIKIKALTKEERKELKYLMKSGYKLFDETIATIGKGV